jgi:flagellar assembly protein FliH
MQQSGPIKFNFDTVFGPTGATTGARTRSSYSSAEVDTIRREAFAQAKADAEVQAAAARTAALGAVAQGVARLFGELDARTTAMRRQSAALALQVGRKLAETALTAFPLKEVEALLADCLHKVHSEPRIVVRTSTACAESLRAEVDALCAEHGYTGRLIVVAEPLLSGADCRIEWADGGIERDLAETFAAIERNAEHWCASTTTSES